MKSWLFVLAVACLFGFVGCDEQPTAEVGQKPVQVAPEPAWDLVAKFNEDGPQAPAFNRCWGPNKVAEDEFIRAFRLQSGRRLSPLGEKYVRAEVMPRFKQCAFGGWVTAFGTTDEEKNAAAMQAVVVATGKYARVVAEKLVPMMEVD